MSASTRASRLRNLALSECGFLFDPATGNTYSLNPSGAFVLRALIEGRSGGELPTGLAAAFETDEETAARDSEQFLLQLRDLGLWEEDDEREEDAS